MTPDDLDDLRAAMAAATPRPDPAVRAAHLRLAQESFDRLQAAGAAARPRSGGPLGALWTGVRTMLNAMTSRGALSAATALAACGILVLTPVGRGAWDLGGRGTPPQEPPGATATTAAVPAPPESAAAPKLEREVARTEAPAAPPPAPVAPASLDEARLQADAADAGSAALAAPEAAGAVEYGSAMADTAAPMATAEADGYAAAPPAAGSAGFAAEVAPPPLPDTEAFASADPNPLKVAAEEPVSTFSIDVDTASYGVVRQSLMSGAMPPPEAVRIEELINYFPYDLAAPEPGEGAFRATVSAMPTPWNPGTRLVAIALQGQRPEVEDRPPLNLVFLIDTSGSMEDPGKLPLLRQSLGLMLDGLRPGDEVAVVTYAGSSGLVLPPTPASEADAIRRALDALMAGGSTNGQGGLEQAYDVARGMAGEGQVTRVVLATDGDFNVGLSDPSALADYIAEQRQSGAFLSVLGFGRGNLDDATMQALAQNGNGQAAYIDSLAEARKVLVDQFAGEMFPIAQDVKVQVEWNPATVAEYRLIGYETRALRREDFADDRVDAGEIGAGHAVTAIYEVTPVGSPARRTEPLRYRPEVAAAGAPEELGFLRLRWKAPGGTESELREVPITGSEPAGDEARWAAAVAGWGQLLRGEDRWLGDWSHGDAVALALGARGADPYGYRAEAIQLMRLSESLDR